MEKSEIRNEKEIFQTTVKILSLDIVPIGFTWLFTCVPTWNKNICRYLANYTKPNNGNNHFLKHIEMSLSIINFPSFSTSFLPSSSLPPPCLLPSLVTIIYVRLEFNNDFKKQFKLRLSIWVQNTFKPIF